MSKNIRDLGCLIISFLACVISLLCLMINTFEIESLTDTVDELNIQIVKQNNIIAEQSEEIEFYKQYCDDVARCIVDGEW